MVDFLALTVLSLSAWWRVRPLQKDNRNIMVLTLFSRTAKGLTNIVNK